MKPITVILLSFLIVLGAALWYIDYANRTHPAPWPMMFGDSGRRHYADQPLPSAPELLWSYDLAAAANPWIVAGEDGSIYVGTGTGLTVVGPDGGQRWAWMGKEEIQSVALGRQGVVYVHANDGVRAFDPHGQLLWVRALAQRIGGLMLVGQGGVIYSVAYPYLYAISDDGNVRWRYQLSELRTPPAETKEGHIVMVLGETLVAINRTGQEAWRTSLGEIGGATMLMVGVDGSIYVRGRDGLLIRDPKERLTEISYEGRPYSAFLAAGKGMVQDGLTRRNTDGRSLWSVGSSDPDALFLPVIDSRGRTLIIRASSSHDGPNGASLDGTTGAVIRRQATILDSNGQIEWEADLAVPIGPAIVTGDGRFCYVGLYATQTRPALLCFGNK